MDTIRRHLNYSKLVTAICLFLLLAGAAWASVGTSGSAPIHGCYSKRSGVLRVAARCRHGEKAISWSKTGPIGPAGARGKGATGPRGPSGPSGSVGAAGQPGGTGPSDVYAAGVSLIESELTSSFVSLGSITLPAGSYLLEGKLNFIASKSAAMSEIFCLLAADTTSTPEWDGTNASAAKEFRQTVSLSAVATFAASQQVSLICRAAQGSGTVDDAHVIAVKTATLHGSTPHD